MGVASDGSRADVRGEKERTKAGSGEASASGDVPAGSRGPAGVNAKAKSWSSVAKGGMRSRAGDRMVSKEELNRLQEVFSEALIFPKEELEEARNEWRGKTLIGKFLSRRFDSDFVAKALIYRWKPVGDVEIIPTINGFYLFRFACEEDLLKVRSGGPTVVGGAVLALEEWRENFKPNRDSISKATVWLRMPGLPSELWKRNFILAIANKAGRPIQIDFCTENMLRGGFARVCVEVDLSRPLVAGVPVGPPDDQIFQEFVYENIGLYCFRCGMIGHGVHECSCNSKEVRIKVAKIVDRDGVVLGESQGQAEGDGAESQAKSVAEEEVVVNGDLYGPWLAVPARKPRRVPVAASNNRMAEGTRGSEIMGANQGSKKGQTMQIPNIKERSFQGSPTFVGSKSEGAIIGDPPIVNGRFEWGINGEVPPQNEKLGQPLNLKKVQHKKEVGLDRNGPKERNFGRVKLVGSSSAEGDLNPHVKSFSEDGLGRSNNTSGSLIIFSAEKPSTSISTLMRERSSKGKCRVGKNVALKDSSNRFLALEAMANEEDGDLIFSGRDGMGIQHLGAGQINNSLLKSAVKRRRNSNPVLLHEEGGRCVLEDEKENVDGNIQLLDDPMGGDVEGKEGTHSAQ